MKNKDYEKTNILIIGCFLIVIIELIFFFYLYFNKMYNYLQLSTVVVDNNYVMAFLDVEERKTLYKNKYLYVDDKKEKFIIKKDNGKTFDNKYYEMYLKFKLNKKYKINDSVVIVLKNKKMKVLEIFKLIWGGDLNRRIKRL